MIGTLWAELYVRNFTITGRASRSSAHLEMTVVSLGFKEYCDVSDSWSTWRSWSMSSRMTL